MQKVYLKLPPPSIVYAGAKVSNRAEYIYRSAKEEKVSVSHSRHTGPDIISLPPLSWQSSMPAGFDGPTSALSVCRQKAAGHR